MPLTIQDVRREVRTALSRISIIDSDTIEVLSGDKPLQPSVKAGAGVTGGAGINISAGVVSIADFDSLPDIDPNPDLTELFVPIWNDQIGGFPQSVTLQDLLTLTPNVADEGTSSSPDLITFFDVGSSANFTTTILNFLSDNVLLIDHGGLGGLADVADHPAYLLVDGTRDLTGELDLDGQKLVLSADGLSFIHSLASTLVNVDVDNVNILSLQGNVIVVKVPVNLASQVLAFGGGAEMQSPSGDALDVLIDSNATVQFRTLVTGFTTTINMGDNLIELSVSGSEAISATGSVITMKVVNQSQVLWSDNLVEMGNPGDPYVLSSKAPVTGLVGLFTIMGADAIFEGAGGSLLLHGGFGNSGTDGTLQFATADATVRLEIKLDGTVDIRDTVIDEDLITLGDAGAAFLIVPKAPSVAVGVDLTVRAGPADGGNRKGGDLFLEGGTGTGIGADGDVFIRTGSGVVLAKFKVDGEVDFTAAGMKIASNGAIQGLPSIQVDSGGIIGLDNNNKWVVTSGLLHSWTINGVLAMTLADDTLDGQGTTRLTGFKGMREQFTLGYHTTSTVTTQWVYAGPYAAITSTSTKRGAYMFRSGSIVKLNIVCDVNVVGTGDTLDGVALVSGAAVTMAATISGLTVANGQEASNSQALGVDTFVAGDYISAKRVLTGASPGQVTTDDFIITIEVEYD